MSRQKTARFGLSNSALDEIVGMASAQATFNRRLPRILSLKQR